MQVAVRVNFPPEIWYPTMMPIVTHHSRSRPSPWGHPLDLTDAVSD
jgi:hypothetical protein